MTSYLDACLHGNLSQQGDPLEVVFLYDFINTFTDRKEDRFKSCCTYSQAHTRRRSPVNCEVVIIVRLSPDLAPEFAGSQPRPNAVRQHAGSAAVAPAAAASAVGEELIGARVREAGGRAQETV